MANLGRMLCDQPQGRCGRSLKKLTITSQWQAIQYSKYRISQQLYLMRHAESYHNQAKNSWKRQHYEPNYKHTPGYQTFRLSPALMDPRIIRLQDLQLIPQALEPIELIITSPLRRCLSTAREIVRRNPRTAVLVEPLLSSRLSSAWSVGTPTSKLKQQYPEFDFSFLEHSGQLWMKPFIGLKGDFSDDTILNKFPDNSEQLLKVLDSGRSESYAAFERRVSVFRRVLFKQIQSNGKNGYRPTILIVLHNCVMNILLGKGISEGRIKEKYDFKHCLPVGVSGGCGGREEKMQPKL